MRCIKCHTERPDSDFYRRSDNGKRKGVCKYCEAKRVKLGRVHRKYLLKKIYGITIEQHDAMLAQQGGVCAICKTPPEQSTKGALAVDHDHRTGQVRGLLCGNCNAALGHFKDNPHLCKVGAEYLEKYS